MASKEKAARRSTKDPSPPAAAKGQKKPGSKQQQTVVAVFPDTKNGNRAFAALEAAAGQLLQTNLERVDFEKLDYGETASLDKFYAANVAVVDVTERHMQAALFYQLGLRENFDMRNNVVTVLENQSDFEAGLGQGNGPAAMVSALSLSLSLSLSAYFSRLICKPTSHYMSSGAGCITCVHVMYDELTL